MNTDKYKVALLEELNTLEEELRSVGRKNPSNPNDWEATAPSDIDVDMADEEEVGEMMQEFEGNSAILKELEIRYNNVKESLAKIESGEYGFCKICKNNIEEERLDANPAADTCILHKDNQ
jgi:RNA polymerase-binding transcription factor DksA